MTWVAFFFIFYNMTSCGYLEFLSSFYSIFSSSLISLLSWTFYTPIIVITTNSWTYSIDSQSDWVSGEYLLGWDLVVAGSRVDLSDLDHHRYSVDDDSGGDGDGSSHDCVHLFQERENKDEARSSYESHVKGGPKNNRALIFRDLVVSGLLQQRQKVWSWYFSIQVLYLLSKIIA